MIQIHLEKYAPNKTVFITRRVGLILRGIIERELWSFQTMEHKIGKIQIVFPEKTEVVNKTFFLGLLAEEMVVLGEESFRSVYSIKGLSKCLACKFDDAIEASKIANLTTKQILEGK